MKNILILGGDGYLGWPTAVFFSKKGYNVTVVDNYFKRNTCKNLNINTLYSTLDLVEKSKIWYDLTGYEIKVVISDLRDHEEMRKLFSSSIEYNFAIDHKFAGIPETVIHFAEQPSAPYSVYDYKSANFTLINNLSVTNNLSWAIKEFDKNIHIIKLGTMGEYGTPNIDIEEGWIDINHKGRTDKFLFPRQASSLYHTTKIMDTDLLWYYVRIWDLKVTDLMQGPVYGNITTDTDIDDRLKTSFHYDEIFGTVINRFLVQAVADYPLTIYGEGDQTRGYLNIIDTLKCIYASENNPPKSGELKIFNQIVETFSVNQLAEMISKAGNEMGMKVNIKKIKNPRKEKENHYYNPTYKGLKEMGIKPKLLTNEIIKKMISEVLKYKNNINKDKIFNGIKW